MISLSQSALHVTLRSIADYGSALSDADAAARYYAAALRTLVLLTAPAQDAGLPIHNAPGGTESDDCDIRWSRDRQALLRRDFPTRDPAALMKQLHALPGLAVTWRQVTSYARGTLKITRRLPADADRPTRIVSVLTPAQADAARRLWPQPIALAQIVAELCTLGPAVTQHQICGFATRDKLGRRPRPAAQSSSEIASTALTNPVDAPAASRGRLPEPRPQSSAVPAGAARPPAATAWRATMDERDRLEAQVLLRKGRSSADIAKEFGQPVHVIEALRAGMTL